MRNSTTISKGIFESILDDITIDDNSTSKSSEVVATNVLKNNNGRVVLENGQTEWRYRLKITKYTMDYVRSEKEVEDEMKDILDIIFSSCRYVYNYEICLVAEPRSNNRIVNSHIDVIFNFRKTSFMRAMKSLFIPLMTLYYEHQNYRFHFIDLFGLDKPAEFTSLTFEYDYSIVKGDQAFNQDKGGIYYDFLILYNIATRQIHKSDENDQVFLGFYNLLMWSVFKKKWIDRFRKFKKDEDGYSIFDVDVSVADLKYGSLKGTIRLLAKDQVTMATKMIVLRVICNENHWLGISEKHDKIIPICTNSLKHQYRRSIKASKNLLDMLGGETDETPNALIKVSELLRYILHEDTNREQRLEALQEFGLDKTFSFSF